MKVKIIVDIYNIICYIRYMLKYFEKRKPFPRKFILRPTEDDHVHYVYLNYKYHGESTEANGHTHKVHTRVCKPAKGYSDKHVHSVRRIHED